MSNRGARTSVRQKRENKRRGCRGLYFSTVADEGLTRGSSCATGRTPCPGGWPGVGPGEGLAPPGGWPGVGPTPGGRGPVAGGRSPVVPDPALPLAGVAQPAGVDLQRSLVKEPDELLAVSDRAGVRVGREATIVAVVRVCGLCQSPHQVHRRVGEALDGGCGLPIDDVECCFHVVVSFGLGRCLRCVRVHELSLVDICINVKRGAAEHPFDQSPRGRGKPRTLSFALNFDGGGRGCDSVRTIRGWQGPNGAGRQ